MDSLETTHYMNRLIQILQTLLAGVFVLLFFAGLINVALQVIVTLVGEDISNSGVILDLIGTTIELVLYLFIVTELYRTVIAYVEGKSVVTAVIHAGLIAVTRQIIIFKPANHEASEALLIAVSHAILLVALFLGFWIVHNMSEEERTEEIT